MRLLVRSRIARAFGTLNGLDDASARAFVNAARTGIFGTVLRWGLAGFAFLIFAVAGLIVVGIYIPEFGHWHGPFSDDDLNWTPVVCWLACGILIATVIALWVRDVVLAWQVHRVFKRRARCWKCRYHLDGMTLDSSGVATCPECGTTREVRQGAGEVQEEPDGRRTLRPIGPALDDRTIARRRRRKWRVVGITLSSIALPVLGACVWFERRVAADVALARSERHANAVWRELVAAAQTAPVTGAKGENQWPKVIKPLEQIRRVTWQVGQAASNIGSAKPIVDYTIVYTDNPTVPATLAPPGNHELDALFIQTQRDLAAEAIRRLRDNGTLAQMAEWPTLKIVMRPFVGELDDDTAINFMMPDLGMARHAARMNAARMELALQAGDRDEYVAAMEQTLVLGEFVMRQPTLIDRLVGIAVHSLVLGRICEHSSKYPDAAWVDAVAACLDRQREPMSIAHTINSGRRFGLDALQWVYSSRGHLLRTICGYNDMLGTSIVSPATVAFVVRRYASMRDELNAAYDYSILVATTPSTRRAALPPPPDFVATGTPMNPFLSSITLVLSKVATSDDQWLSMRRSTRVMLAIERVRQSAGAYPASLQELAQSAGQPPLDLVDPLTEKTYGYLRLSPSAANGWRSYILYSNGNGANKGGELDPNDLPSVIIDAAINPPGKPPSDSTPAAMKKSP